MSLHRRTPDRLSGIQSATLLVASIEMVEWRKTATLPRETGKRRQARVKSEAHGLSTIRQMTFQGKQTLELPRISK